MKTKLASVAVTAGLALLTCGIAGAEDQHGFSTESWYAIGGASLLYPDTDLDASNDSPGLHLRLGRELTENIDLQIGFSYHKADEDHHSFDGGDYKQFNLTADALYVFSRDKFRPFVLAGIGASNNRISYSIAPGYLPAGKVSGSETSLAGNFGVGFQYLFNDQFGLQADFRRIISKAEAKTSEMSVDGTIANNLLNIGLLYRFGGKPAAIPEPKQEPVAQEPQVVERIVEVEKIVPAEPQKIETHTFFASALFELNEYKLSEEGKNILKTQIAQKLLENKALGDVTIEGHTDRLGTDAINEQLSLRRANAVRDFLISQGVDGSRLKTIGKSSSEPLVFCEGPRSERVIKCLQPNRRVVVQIEVRSGS
ncbi:MAG TPA: outer membrane beta-barrel protein [Methylophilaceae bacterium]|jgi:OOP family OmpA-OmpF porin